MKKLPITCYLLLFICLSLFTLNAASPVFSQGFSLSISPPLLEAIMQPGKKITHAYQVKNNSSSPITLIPHISSFEPVGEQGQTKIVKSQKIKVQSYENWFSFLNVNMSLDQPFTLAPNQDLQLVLKISLPQNAPEGDYYQTLLLEQVSPGTNNQNNATQTLGTIGSNILLTVSQTGRPEKKAEIIEFVPKNALLGRFFDSFSNIQFNLRIKNTGKAFFKPIGEISIATDNLPLRPDNILAGTIRQVQCENGSCQIKPPNILGRYQAQLKFTLDENGASYEKTVSFWVLPIKLTIGIIIAILLLYGILSLRKRRQKT